MYDWHFAHQCSSSLWTIYLIYRSTLAKQTLNMIKRNSIKVKKKYNMKETFYAWSIKQHIFLILCDHLCSIVRNRCNRKPKKTQHII